MYFAIFRPANFITIRSRVYQEKEGMNSIMLKKKSVETLNSKNT